jgi:hypothetical protein
MTTSRQRTIDLNSHNKTISTIYHEWLKENQLNLHPSYQRDPCWKDEQKSLLIDTFVWNDPCPSFLIYDGDSLECIDGQNRLCTIKEYIEQTPTKNNKPFPWIVTPKNDEESDEDDEEDDNNKEEVHIFFQSTPEFDLYVEQMNLKYKNKGRIFRFMTPKERKAFMNKNLSVQTIQSIWEPEKRQALFMKWQNGTKIKVTDQLKNEKWLYCEWFQRHCMELANSIGSFLKSGKNNSIYDTYRILLAFRRNQPVANCMIGTLTVQKLIKTDSLFNEEEFTTELLPQATQFLNAIKPMQKYSDKIHLSHLLHYAYRWFTAIDDVLRKKIESEKMIQLWTVKSLRDYKHRHSTMNQLKKSTTFIQSLPQIDQDFNNSIDDL